MHGLPSPLSEQAGAAGTGVGTGVGGFGEGGLGVGGGVGCHDATVHARVGFGGDGKSAVAVDVAIVQGPKLWGRLALYYGVGAQCWPGGGC